MKEQLQELLLDWKSKLKNFEETTKAMIEYQDLTRVSVYTSQSRLLNQCIKDLERIVNEI